MTENEISYLVRKSIFNVYNKLGPGLLESVYEKILIYELRKNDLKVENQVKLPVYYDDQIFNVDFRLDILIENKVILEIKSVKNLEDVHYKQVLTYLKLSNLKLGILVNFNSDDISEDIKRIVNRL